ncbi:hypothetical protein V6N12_047373 [Hibiscus sabdariffa]|uniref:Uncharacterized protein n=1 Tax=Hibiscus sabdariffa TaxID=183260 RepID=A0ABR2DDI9_9ROSI
MTAVDNPAPANYLAQPLKASAPLVAAAKSYIQPMVSGSENVYNAERDGDSIVHQLYNHQLQDQVATKRYTCEPQEMAPQKQLHLALDL